MDQMSPHFTLSELTTTQTGHPNEPPPQAAENLRRLCDDLLEPIRTLLGDVPLVVHSGYRSEKVNRAVGGERNSAHLEGRACDFHPHTAERIRPLFERIRLSEIPYDKLILEYKGSRYWLHAQIPKAGNAPRRKAYIAQVTDTGTAYREIV